MNTSQLTRVAVLLQQGITAARAGRSQEAQDLLRQVVSLDPTSEMAWLWLSGLINTQEQKIACLERVLMANPDNLYARAGLERLRGGSLPEADAGQPWDQPTPESSFPPPAKTSSDPACPYLSV